MESGEKYFHKETENFIVYFIFTKTTAHVILRKTLNWKQYDNKIHKKSGDKFKDSFTSC